MVPALICLNLLYAFLALVALPQKAFFSSDEGLKFIQMQNILRKGWSDLTLQYPGRDVDPDLNYVPINNPPPLIREGHVYAVYPVAFPTLAAPLFSMFGYAGLYLIPIASGLLTIAVTGRLARIANLEPLAPALLLGLGTPLLFYSLLFWDHTLGALLSTLGLLLVAEHLRAPRTWLLFAGGLLVGSSVWIRTELYAMAVVVLVVYFVVGGRRLRETLFLCLGTLLALLPLWLFQYFTYGGFLGPHLGHLASVSSSLPISSNRLAIFYYLLLESNSDPRFAFLFLMSFAAAATVVASRRFRRVPWLVVVAFGALVLCCLPILRQAWSGLPMGGLIATTPFLVLTMGTLFNGGRSRVVKFLGLVCGGYIAVVCLTTPVDPGLQWGPRFLLPALPLATILALLGLQALTKDVRRPDRRALVGVCLLSTVAISLLLQGGSIRILHLIKNRDRQLIESTAQLPSPWVISDEYGYAQYVAPLFYEKVFFYVRTQRDYEQLTKTLFDRGVTTFAVATYPTPHRQAIDPLEVTDGYTVRKVGDQLFEIGTSDAAG